MKDSIAETKNNTGKTGSGLLSISPDRLCIGLYVQLDVSWMKHPFLFKNFLIKDEKQLQILKSLNLEKISINISRSKAEPLPPNKGGAETPDKSEIDVTVDVMMKEKQRRVKKLKARREKMVVCENNYRKTMAGVKSIVKKIRDTSPDTVKTAEGLVGSIVSSFLTDREASMHLVNVKGNDEDDHFHVVNVAVLSLMLGNALMLEKDQLRKLGFSALFHDMGKSKIPAKVLRKKEKWTVAERKLYEMHPEYGVEMGREIKSLPQEAFRVIAQHHEAVDGSGFPKGLKGGEISAFAKIVRIANTYDNYCNQIDPKKSMTPYQAVSFMYAKERHKYEEEMLAAFISSLGVYPPGTILKLNEGSIGMVISVNQDVLLKPNILLYNPEIPKEEAVILDLREEELSIEKTITPSSLKPEIFEYLNPSMNVNYFFEGKRNGSDK